MDINLHEGQEIKHLDCNLEHHNSIREHKPRPELHHEADQGISNSNHHLSNRVQEPHPQHHHEPDHGKSQEKPDNHHEKDEHDKKIQFWIVSISSKCPG